MAAILETERLRLREFTRGDLEPLATMMADEDQMWLYPRPRTSEETRIWIDRTIQHYEERGFGFWLMESAENSKFLGYCGIRPRLIDGVEEAEMGWHTMKHFWNQRIATHAAAACRDFAFAQFNIPRLVAIIDPDNPASMKVANKIGMQLERETVVDGWRCILYSLEEVRDEFVKADA
jgi:RimJ/RimL family protein N-acetyltransferase